MTDTKHSEPHAGEIEALSDELARLVREYDTSERQNRQEAWNLIADFAIENCPQLCAALQSAARVEPHNAQCTCGAVTDGKWAGVHHSDCPAVSVVNEIAELIRYNCNAVEGYPVTIEGIENAASAIFALFKSAARDHEGEGPGPSPLAALVSASPSASDRGQPSPDARAAALEEAAKVAGGFYKTIEGGDGPHYRAKTVGECIALAIRALSPLPAAVTAEGWKLVPVEPTEKMLAAAFAQAEATLLDELGNEACKTNEERSAHAIRPLYRAMLSAAPSAPAGDGKKDLDNPTTERSGT